MRIGQFLNAVPVILFEYIEFCFCAITNLIHHILGDSEVISFAIIPVCNLDFYKPLGNIHTHYTQ